MKTRRLTGAGNYHERNLGPANDKHPGAYLPMTASGLIALPSLPPGPQRGIHLGYSHRFL